MLLSVEKLVTMIEMCVHYIRQFRIAYSSNLIMALSYSGFKRSSEQHVACALLLRVILENIFRIIKLKCNYQIILCDMISM